MNRVESLLRAAARDEAAEVGPESVPSFAKAGLPVPRRPLLRSPRRSPPRPGLLRGPLAPLLAAAAVVAVVAVTLALSSVLPGFGHVTGSGTGSAVAAAQSADAVPPDYVALTATGAPATAHPFTITVRSTLTGKALATVAPPPDFGTFSLVGGTANPTTFLVGAQPWHPVFVDDPNPLAKGTMTNYAQPVTLFWLRYDPATHGVRLTPLPLHPLPGTGLLPLVSVSPDGSRLAVAYQDISQGVRIRTGITVYPLHGGSSRSWSAPTSINVPGNEPAPTNIIGTLSWAADDRTVAFSLIGQRSGVYLLDTGDTGTLDLLRASRLAVPLTGQQSNGNFVCADDPRITPGGADVLCGGYTIPAGWSIEAKGYPRGPVTQGFGEFSLSTGKLVTILGAVRAPLSFTGSQPSPYQVATSDDVFPLLLWTSQDAQVTIGLTDGGHAVVVRDGRARRIPWPLSIAIPFGSNSPGTAW
jgi:hypothetical protein